MHAIIEANTVQLNSFINPKSAINIDRPKINDFCFSQKILTLLYIKRNNGIKHKMNIIKDL